MAYQGYSDGGWFNTGVFRKVYTERDGGGIQDISYSTEGKIFHGVLGLASLSVALFALFNQELVANALFRADSYAELFNPSTMFADSGKTLAAGAGALSALIVGFSAAQNLRIGMGGTTSQHIMGYGALL